MGTATTIVLDLETLGAMLHADEDTEEARALREMAAKATRDVDSFVALSPPLARVVCVGMLQLETKREHCAFDAEALRYESTPPEPSHVPLVGERQVLDHVNTILSKASRIVTFNGRCFDLAVLVLRMVAHEVAPCTTLLKAWRELRYKPNVHIDLRDQLTNYGAANGPGTSLRAFALGLGLKDPKANGGGADVGDLVRKGDAASLCEYCMGDVRTTATIYERWVEACGIA